MDQFYQSIGKEDIVLDFGCGIGRVSKFINCKKLYLHDVNQSYLDKAIKNTKGSVWENQKVDWVISVSVFIHMRHEDAEKYFKLCASVANKGMILQIPIYEVENEAIHWFDVSGYTKQQLEKWCNDTSFEIKTIGVNPGQFNFYNIGPYHANSHIFLRK